MYSTSYQNAWPLLAAEINIKFHIRIRHYKLDAN